ncbi:hypothetical protein, partial [Dokdonella sp.]|uniref:hypothetical protein n=1 Tax=Dokdonella sp. TaxID=2291710 RepID=UPI003C4BB901
VTYLLFFFSLFSARFSFNVFSGFFFVFFFESIPLDMTTSLVQVHLAVDLVLPRSQGQDLLARIDLSDQSQCLRLRWSEGTTVAALMP